MVLERLKYIAVDGPICVGKTSLAKMLAQDLEARVAYENPDDNPFIENFYEDVNRYAFQTQLFFLLSRYKQQMSLRQQDLF